jgi:ABC-type oligopeptide transport system substrate-binding subunit
MNSWFADYADPQNFISFLFTSDSNLNHDGFANPAFDKICREADSSQDAQRREKLYQQAEDILVGEAIRIPLYTGRDAQLVSPRVTGIRKNILGVMPHLKTTVK